MGANGSHASADKAEFTARMAGELPAGFSLDDYIAALIAEPKKVATRKASEMALGAINGCCPKRSAARPT